MHSSLDGFAPISRAMPMFCTSPLLQARQQDHPDRPLHIDDLPGEIMLRIFSHLSLRDRCMVACVSKVKAMCVLLHLSRFGVAQCDVLLPIRPLLRTPSDRIVARSRLVPNRQGATGIPEAVMHKRA